MLLENEQSSQELLEPPLPPIAIAPPRSFAILLSKEHPIHLLKEPEITIAPLRPVPLLLIKSQFVQLL